MYPLFMLIPFNTKPGEIRYFRTSVKLSFFWKVWCSSRGEVLDSCSRFLKVMLILKNQVREHFLYGASDGMLTWVSGRNYWYHYELCTPIAHTFYMVTVKECLPVNSEVFPKGSLLLYLCIFGDFKIRFYSFDTVKRNCLKMNLETLHLYTIFF